MKKSKSSTKRKPKKSSIIFSQGLSEIEIEFVRSAEALITAKQATLSLGAILRRAGTPITAYNYASLAIFTGGIETRLKQLNLSWNILAKKGLMRSRKEVEKYMTPAIFQWIMNGSKPNWKGNQSVC